MNLFAVIDRERLTCRGVGRGHCAGCLFVQLMVQAIKRKLEAIGNTKLVIDLAQIVLDHLLGGTELISNFLIALALRNAGDDGQLFRAKDGAGFEGWSAQLPANDKPR